MGDLSIQASSTEQADDLNGETARAVSLDAAQWTLPEVIRGSWDGELFFQTEDV